MHLLIVGATGFIGRHVCARLLQEGHTITAAVRNVDSARRRFPGIQTTRIDMNRMAAPSAWASTLAGVEAVINCAGILQSSRQQSAKAIHEDAPKALFEACARQGVRKIIQISAVSADREAGTEYAITKKAADDYLRSLNLDWIVLRPSLVYGQGSYGGTSVIRGLAGFPFLTPLIGNGEQRFQPIHIDDLSETVARCLDDPSLVRRTLEPVGPETLSLREIVALTRTWLDLPPARPLAIPHRLATVIARIGDVAGSGPIKTTSLIQMEYGNVSDPAAFEAAIGFRPWAISEAFLAHPSHVQDRQHARLYFIYPILTTVLAIFWLGSGFAGLFNPPQNTNLLAAHLGLPQGWGSTSASAFSILDILIGIALATGYRPRALGVIQLVLVAFYTFVLTWAAPDLWTAPYGALLKNLTVLATIAIWTGLGEEIAIWTGLGEDK